MRRLGCGETYFESENASPRRDTKNAGQRPGRKSGNVHGQRVNDIRCCHFPHFDYLVVEASADDFQHLDDLNIADDRTLSEVVYYSSMSDHCFCLDVVGILTLDERKNFQTDPP